MKKNSISHNLKNNAIPWSKVFPDFTPEQNQIVENEIRCYDTLVALRQLRQQHGLTQAKLAQKANLPRTTITKIESGTYNPTIETLMSIATALDKKLRVSFE